MVVFSITLAKQSTCALVINFKDLFHCGDLLLTWKTHCSLKFHFSQFDRSKICMEVSFTLPEPMWTLTMKLPYTKWNFTPKWNLKPVWGHLGFYVNVLLLFTWKTHYGLKFHFGQFDRSEIWTKVSFTLPEVIWKLIMKLPYTEVKLYPKVKSQTSLSSLLL